MKIAIHHRPGSFSDRWIEYCKQKGIDYKIVNAYDSDIVEQVADCDAFMWHHHQSNYKDVLFARQLLYSLQQSGKKVFPDWHTGWHFDDKVGQKYLLEAIGAPLVPSYAFYTKEEALAWINSTSFPKVFKLRGGAGSSNVRLARTKKDAVAFVTKAFSNGFPPSSKWEYMREQIRKWREGKESLRAILRGIKRLFVTPLNFKMRSAEKGYVYFQDFIENNVFDIRVIVIGNKAFAVKRMVRKNDFRASGSGNMHYDKDEIPVSCVKASFEVAKKLKSQCVGFDYVFDKKGHPSIVELGYGFTVKPYDNCPGYWTDDLTWHQESFNPQEWMVEGIVCGVKSEIRLTNKLTTNETSEIFNNNNISISSNRFDMRVVVINGKAMGEKRICREGDFRASGSGKFEYTDIREDVLDVAFDVADKLQLQSVAFDFIFNNNQPLIVEMSYGFGTKGISHAPGYYTTDKQWHEEAIDPQAWLVEEICRIR